ncbi:uncharacterized protein [Pocillopora verrucosa]|uniref:uncharacterized protein n=1 Tax=Pocillopora verrucosa TaxID=203993 RepID=UPI003341FE5D
MVNPELVEEIERSMYVDDLISGGETTKQALEIKMTATAILGVATFKLHKWHSNNQKLEVETSTSDEESQRYAKQQLGTRKGESKLLGVPWDKEKDEIRVSFPISTAEPTKRGILRKVAKIYDPLVLASPVTLSGTHDSSFKTSGWTYGCKPSTKYERSPEGFSRKKCLWLTG